MMDVDNRLRFHAEYSLSSDAYRLLIMRGRESVAAPIEFVPHERGTWAPEHLQLEQHEAQALIDTLWSAGLRPTQGRQSEGVTAAQDRHLQDMRAIAFAKLKVEPPTPEGKR